MFHPFYNPTNPGGELITAPVNHLSSLLSDPLTTPAGGTNPYARPWHRGETPRCPKFLQKSRWDFFVFERWQKKHHKNTSLVSTFQPIAASDMALNKPRQRKTQIWFLMQCLPRVGFHRPGIHFLVTNVLGPWFTGETAKGCICFPTNQLKNPTNGSGSVSNRATCKGFKKYKVSLFSKVVMKQWFVNGGNCRLEMKRLFWAEALYLILRSKPGA